MAAYHSDRFTIQLGEEIADIRACYVTIESRIESRPIEDHVFETAYHIVNDLAVGGSCETDGSGCAHFDYGLS
ncbi:hypothetical protein CLV60_11333 [Dyadobacter jiangsuensis]|uniref:Uncharacterized protein n=1 Tax=Dyadobacter jiangsuensis TaxID=1591085 RepID=A0A2P8FSC3_9BACT|nr:hypothetical protein CLV60_11333 [Dyadobacter jiangsuensis]